MMMKTQWTVQDLAELTVLAVEQEYCENCEVIAIADGDKYCVGCINDIVDYLAIQFAQNVAVDGGLY